MIRTIKEIEKLIATVKDSMGDCDFMVYPSPVRALDVGALLTVARENIELQGKIAAALAIPASETNYGLTDEAANEMRQQFCKVLGNSSKENE